MKVFVALLVDAAINSGAFGTFEVFAEPSQPVNFLIFVFAHNVIMTKLSSLCVRGTLG